MFVLIKSVLKGVIRDHNMQSLYGKHLRHQLAAADDLGGY